MGTTTIDQAKTAATEEANGPPRTRAELRYIALRELHESPRNPRKHYNQAKLEELARSITVSGILTPLGARPRAQGGYEIAAGHRRRRAGLIAEKLLGVNIEAPVMVRPMTDAELMETLVVENGQREDVHPLEEAQGYFELMREEIGYDVAKIAERVGRSKDFVYDRLKLLSLIPKAQELFLESRFTLAHAIILARLNPEAQARAIEPSGNYRAGLFEGDSSGELFAGEDDTRESAEERDPWANVKPRSVREFQDWVNNNVRFETDDPDVGNLFPETADAVVSAEEAEAKVVHITYNAHIRDEARDNGTRTYGPRSWERADGNDGSKECEHSVLGVIVVGPGRGQAFAVCIAKKTCLVHYGTEIRAREKREKEASKNGGTSAVTKAREAQERENEKYEQQRKRAEAEAQRWRKAAPAISAAVAERIRKASLSALADVLALDVRTPKAAADEIPRGRSADDLLRHLAFGILHRKINDQWSGPRTGPDVAKRMGVDVKKILDEHAPIDQGAEKSKGGAKK